MFFKKNLVNILLISLVIIIFIRLFYVENYCNIDKTQNFMTVDKLQSMGLFPGRRDELIQEVRESYHDMCNECLRHYDDPETCNSLIHCSTGLPGRGERPSFTLGEGIDDYVCDYSALTEDERHSAHRKDNRDSLRLTGGYRFRKK